MPEKVLLKGGVVAGRWKAMHAVHAVRTCISECPTPSLPGHCNFKCSLPVMRHWLGLSYKRVTGRAHTVEERIRKHPHRLHAIG